VNNKNSFFYRLYVVSLMPILVALANGAAFLFRWFMLESSSSSSHDAGDVIAQHTTAFLLLTYLVLPPCSMVQFQALDCQTLPDPVGASFLRIDSKIDCNDLKYKQFRVAVVLFVAVYQAIPPLWLLLLHRKQRELNPPTSDKRLAMFVRDHDPKLNTLRFLFGEYNPVSGIEYDCFSPLLVMNQCSELDVWCAQAHYYFETIEMWRRIFFIGIVPLLSTKAVRRSAIGFFCSLLSYIFYREVEPFQRRSTNVVAYVAQFSILMTYGAALVIETDLSHGMSDGVLGTILVFTNLAVIGLALWLGYSRYRLEVARELAAKQNQAQRVEWAVGFSDEKFSTTFEAIDKNIVPASHAMLFWYGPLEAAQRALASGVPATDALGGGVALTLHRPHELDANDDAAFPPHLREAILVLSVRTCCTCMLIKVSAPSSNCAVIFKPSIFERVVFRFRKPFCPSPQ